MHIETIVPSTERICSKNSSVLTLRDVLLHFDSSKLAGKEELTSITSAPEEVIGQLREGGENQSFAVLLCGDIELHDNGSEYVPAVRLKGRRDIVIEKYFLDDPMLPSFIFAIKS